MLLLAIEDRYQAVRNMAIEEADRYGLTPREKEVWILHRIGLTYKQTASELCITPNTVKKHMKSIYVKAKVEAANLVDFLASVNRTALCARFKSKLFPRSFAPRGFWEIAVSYAIENCCKFLFCANTRYKTKNSFLRRSIQAFDPVLLQLA